MLFVFSKLLAFLPFGNLLKGASGKFVLFAGIAIAIGFLVWNFKAKIKAEISQVFYQQQLEDQLADQKKELDRLVLIEGKRNQAIIEAIQRNESLILSVEQGRTSIRSLEAQPATQPLIEAMKTIKDLQKIQKPAEEPKEDSGNSVIDSWKKRIFGGGDE